MIPLSEEDSARMHDDSQDLVQTGTTQLILRQPLPPDGKVNADFELDDDFKTPTKSVANLPFLERPIVAKVRSINDKEMASTGIGELQLGDLVADIDPDFYDDSVRPVSTLDEIRFAQNTVLPGEGGLMTVSSDWDFMVHGIRPAWSGNLCVKLRLVLRRKKIKTEGGAESPSF